MDSRTVLDKPDLIRIRYGQMRIFPGDFIHGGGFKNTKSDGNFRMQLLIIDDGHKLYKPLDIPTISIILLSHIKICYVIILEKMILIIIIGVLVIILILLLNPYIFVMLKNIQE